MQYYCFVAFYYLLMVVLTTLDWKTCQDARAKITRALDLSEVPFFEGGGKGILFDN